VQRRGLTGASGQSADRLGLEAAVASAPRRAPDDETAVAMERRVELYRTLVALVSQLDSRRPALQASAWRTDRAHTDAKDRR
jgi:hypothetical protein